MRVVHVAPTPFGSTGLFGGGERYPLELARALAPEIDCKLVTFSRGAQRWREPNGLRVRVLPTRWWAGGHPAHPISLGLLDALRGADIVHTHHLHSAPSRIAAVAGRALGNATVVTDHGLQGSDWGGLLPRLFDRFLTVSQYSAQELGTPHERTKIIYGGVDTARFRPDPSAHRQGALFVGRITPHKGVDCLIEALPEAASLEIVGTWGHDPRPPESRYPTLLRDLAVDREVTFHGPASENDLPSLYQRAAVLVLPSVHRTCYGRWIRVSELLGLAVIEAMASGTPIICSRLGGLPEVVLDGVTGYLVEPGNVRELRERMSELLGDRERAARLGRNGRDLVLERFTWRKCAERCLDAYDKLLNKPRLRRVGPVTAFEPSSVRGRRGRAPALQNCEARR